MEVLDLAIPLILLVGLAAAAWGILLCPAGIWLAWSSARLGAQRQTANRPHEKLAYETARQRLTIYLIVLVRVYTVLISLTVLAVGAYLPGFIWPVVGCWLAGSQLAKLIRRVTNTPPPAGWRQQIGRCIAWMSRKPQPPPIMAEIVAE